MNLQIVVTVAEAEGPGNAGDNIMNIQQERDFSDSEISHHLPYEPREVLSEAALH
jgi:hypothetical protein